MGHPRGGTAMGEQGSPQTPPSRTHHPWSACPALPFYTRTPSQPPERLPRCVSQSQCFVFMHLSQYLKGHGSPRPRPEPPRHAGRCLCPAGLPARSSARWGLAAVTAWQPNGLKRNFKSPFPASSLSIQAPFVAEPAMAP